MKLGGIGGRSTKTGLVFEGKVDIVLLLQSIDGYEVISEVNQPGKIVLFKGKRVARIFVKNEFYAFLKREGVDFKLIISKKIIPDSALLVIIRKTLYIIEVKYQQVNGSVDEKLQTCDFKRKQYQKLVTPLNLKVEYVYVLNDWFKDKKYKDTLDYIINANCYYYFNEIPLAWLNLPS